MIIHNAYVFDENSTFTKKTIYTLKDTIVSESIYMKYKATNPISFHNEITIDGRNLFAIPGLIDLHLHGCAGHDFCEGTMDSMNKIAAYQLRNGITTFVPATMTLTEDTLLDICSFASTYKNNVGSIFGGIYLEGPFLSKEKKGAQNERFLKDPDILMFEHLLNQSKDLLN